MQVRRQKKTTDTATTTTTVTPSTEATTVTPSNTEAQKSSEATNNDVLRDSNGEEIITGTEGKNKNDVEKISKIYQINAFSINNGGITKLKAIKLN